MKTKIRSLDEVIESVRNRKKSGPVQGSNYFFKSAYGRCPVIHQGIPYTIEDEFNTISSMYSVLPNNVPGPFYLVRDSEGKITGYLMRKVRGKKLRSFLYLPDKTKRELAEALNVLQQQKIANGDIRAKNVLIEHGHPIFIDPAGANNSVYHENELAQDRRFGESILSSFPAESECSGQRAPYFVFTGLLNKVKDVFHTRVAYNIRGQNYW